MGVTGLADLVLQDETLAAAVDDARSGTLRALDLTATTALRPFVVRGLVDAGRTVLAVAATAREAEDLVARARGRHGSRRSWATTRRGRRCPHERLSPRSDTVGRRLAVLRRLEHPGTDRSNGPLRVVVAPVRSVLQPQVRGLADLEPVELSTGGRADLEDVVRRLADAAYHRVDLVERRGEFAVRGGIVDVFPPTEEHPLRVEFWGDEVEEIRPFAVADQRTLEKVERLWAPPCRELLLTDEVRARARELAETHPQLAEISEKLAEGHAVEGMESLTPVLDRRDGAARRPAARRRHGPGPATPSASEAAPTTWSRPARSSSRRRGPPRPPAAVAPIDLGAASYHSLERRAGAQPRAGQAVVDALAVRPPTCSTGRTRRCRCGTCSARSCRPASTSRPARWSHGRSRLGRSTAYRGDVERAVEDVARLAAQRQPRRARPRGPRAGAADGRGAQRARRPGPAATESLDDRPRARASCTSPPRARARLRRRVAVPRRADRRRPGRAAGVDQGHAQDAGPPQAARSTRSSSSPATTSCTSSTASAATSR